ncbi:hypothetical protein [Microbulbifer variabilis]|uniref:hypothetical protein n=1 Tax=Microbulbifer variabilis TaxID=266805 RepID=UPI001CFDCE4A|nr:hypothetical protein [Microbulbifer variabilis]
MDGEWKLLPIKLTAKMENAVAEACFVDGAVRPPKEIWEAVLLAAPNHDETVEEDLRIVPAKRLNRLEEAEDMLCALQAAGVDNWSGYDFAMECLRND